MYGLNTLPNTGVAATGMTVGVVTQSLWLALLIVTVITLLAALGRMIPRHQS